LYFSYISYYYHSSMPINYAIYVQV
jgi:hypothetical protein